MSAGESDPLNAVQSSEKKPAETLAETDLQSQTTAAREASASARSESPQDWVGRTLGKYQILSVLGQGGMGVVFRAHDPLIERDVAIKLLAEHLTDDSTAFERFLSEARAAGKISHPNVTAIHGICQEETRYFLVLELLTGGSLGDDLERGACSVLAATRAMLDACQGVAAAHAAGLIHRDIKPANFMRSASGAIKVADFGLAKSFVDTRRHITQSGAVLGTPYFMSPEQCMGKPLDLRTDIYSLGATYYCLLTGKYPYEETSNVPQLMFNHCHAPIPDPCAINASIPPACSRIVARAMAKSPSDRYQSADEMLADLQALFATLSGQVPQILPSESAKAAALATTLTATSTAPPAPSAACENAARRRLVLGAAAGLTLGVLLAGGVYFAGREGNTASGDAELSGATLQAAAPTSQEPIKVGVLHSMSGTMAASATPVVDATLFAIAELNARGGLLGRQVQAIVVDGRSDWPRFAREAERLITEEKVAAIFGCWTSSSRKAVKPVVEEHDHLLLYPLQYEGLETSPNIVYLGAAPNQQIIPALDWAVREFGKRKFFLVGSDYIFPRAASEVIKDHLETLGAEVVGEAYLPLGSQHAEPIVEAIRATQPDMILNLINGDSNIAFFCELREANIRQEVIPTLSFSIDEQGLKSLSASEVAGDYAAWTYFDTLDTPENRDFVRRFQEKFPQRNVTDPMEAAYAGVLLWAAAVEDVGSVDPKKVRRAMLTTRIMTPAGELRLDPDTQHAYKTPRVGQIQADGTFHIVWSADKAAVPDPFPQTRTSVEWKAFLHDLYTSWGREWSAPERGTTQDSATP